MVDWLESIAKDEIGDFSDNIEFYAKTVYWWVQTFFAYIHFPIKCKIHSHRITLEVVFLSCSLRSLLFFKFIHVKIEISYPSTEVNLRNQLVPFGRQEWKEKPSNQLNLIFVWLLIFACLSSYHFVSLTFHQKPLLSPLLSLMGFMAERTKDYLLC